MRLRSMSVFLCAVLAIGSLGLPSVTVAADPSRAPSPTASPPPSEPLLEPEPSASPSGDPLPTPSASPTPLPTAAPSPTANEPIDPDELDPADELLAERTESSRTYDLGDGRRVTEFFVEPVYYKPDGPDGPFVEIEPGFAAVEGGDKAVTSDKAPAAITVAPAGDARGFLSVADAAGFRVALRPLVTDGTLDAVARAAEPTIDATTADLAEVFPGIDGRILAQPDAARLYLILDAAPKLASWTFLVDVPEGTTLSIDKETGAVDLFDAKGERRAIILAPYALDSTPDELTGGGRMTTELAYTIGDHDGTPTVTVSIDDPAWLEKAVYPVYVDPAIYLPGTNTYGDTFVNEGNPSMNYANYQRPDSPYYYEMWLGQSPSQSTYYTEAYLKFNVAELAGKVIDTADIRVYPYHQYYNAPTATRTWLRRIVSSGAWTESGLTWNNKPNGASTGILTADCVEAQHCSFAATTLVRNWVDGSYVNNGIRLDENGNGATYWKRIIASEENLPGSPRLVVEYHTPDAPSTPDLVVASDSGTSDTDNVTNVMSPTFSGTAEAGATVTLYSGTTPIGSATATGGAWTITSQALVGDGVRSITAKATVGGETGPASAALSITIDTTLPNASSVPDLDATSDLGSSSSDNITKDDTPTFNGTAEAGSTVRLLVDGNEKGSGGASPWSITTAALTNGTHSVTVTATDLAGNISPASAALSITIDTTLPNVPSTPDLDATSDLGSSPTDNVTKDDTPTFTGTAETGATIHLLVDGVEKGTGNASPWSITTTSLTNGTHSVTATATDLAGNTGPASAALSITIDTVAPSGTVGINSGAPYTGSADVTLTLTAADDRSGPSQMRFSNNGGIDWSGPEAVAATKLWTLAAGDGNKSVSYEVTDHAGNASQAFTDTIVIDTSPAQPNPPDVTCNGPDVYQAIANGQCFFRPAASTTLTVLATALDAQSAIEHVRFQGLAPLTGWTPAPVLPNDDGADPYQQDLTFSPATGSATLEVVARNGAGLDTSVRTLSLTADVTGPTATFSSPPDGTTMQSVLTVVPEWGSELDTSDGVALGAGIASRSLQSWTSPLAAGACADAWQPQGDPFTGLSPAPEETLQADACYQWRLTLVDRVGNVEVTTSGSVIVAAEPTIGVTQGGILTRECTITEWNGSCATPNLPNMDPGNTYWYRSTVDSCRPNANTMSAGINQGSYSLASVSHGTMAVGTFVPVRTNAFRSADGGAYSSGPIQGVLSSGFYTGRDNRDCHLTIEVAWVEGSNPWTRPYAHLSGDTVFFKGSGSGSVQLTATGSTPTGTITSNTFSALSGTPTGWTPSTEQTSASNPFSTSYAWTTGAVDTSTSVTSHNSAGYESGATVLSLASDTEPPTTAFVAPIEGGNPVQGTTSYTIEFSAQDSGSGFGQWGSGWWLTRQKATITNGYCNTFAADIDYNGAQSGNAWWAGGTTSGENLSVTQSLSSGACYRWVLTARDAVGNTSTQRVSGSVLAGVTPGPVRALRAIAPAETVVGATTYISVATIDEDGEPIASLVGRTITLTSNDPGAVFLDAAAGAHQATHTVTTDNLEMGKTFRVLFSTPGDHTITATAPEAVISTQTVHAKAAALRSAAPVTVFAGVPFKYLVIPRIESKTAGALNKAYGATLTFSSSDGSAVYGPEVDANDRYTFICNCDGSRIFPTTLTELGEQTLTVTDQFGTTDTVTVSVVAAPGGGTPTIDRIDVVYWHQGNTIDYYVTASGPYQLLWVQDSCGLMNGSINESGGGIANGDVVGAIAMSVGSGAGITNVMAMAVGGNQEAMDAMDLINAGRLPNGVTTTDEPYASASKQSKAENGACGPWGFNETHDFTFFYTDGQGHVFSTVGQGNVESYYGGVWRTFGEIPNNEHFEQQGPDDPVVSWDITRGPNGETSYTRNLASNQGIVPFVPNGMAIDFNSRLPFVIYQVQWWASATYGYYNLGPKWAMERVPAGESTVYMADVPYHNSCIDQKDTEGGWIWYSGPQNRRGMLSSVHFWPQSTYPKAGWGCNGPSDGEESEHNLLHDMIERLFGGINDVANGIVHFDVGDPVDVVTGAQTGNSTDFALGGLSPSLVFTRLYSSDTAEAVANGIVSAADADSLLGRGWGSNLDWRLLPDLANDVIRVRGGDGHFAVYQQLTDTSWAGPSAFRMKLTEITGGYLLTRALGDGYRFDDTGRLVAIRDVHDREMTLAWEVSGKLDSFTDPAGRTADVTTNAAGRITRIDLPDGRHVAYTYDAVTGYLSSARSLDGEILSYHADNRGRVTKVLDTEGRLVLANTYDGRGRVIVQTDALGVGTGIAYDATNMVRIVYGPRGDISLTCLNPDGTTRATLDALDGLRRYTYDNNAQVTGVTNELAQRTRLAYDAHGNITKVTDPLGRSVVTAYDSEGRVETVTGPAGDVVTTAYDPSSGLPETVTQSDASHAVQVYAYGYDASGMPTSFTDAEGGVSTMHYDARGYVDYMIDAEGRKTTYTTDARGFVTAVVGPAGNVVGADPADYTTTSTYDDMGRVLTVTNALGQQTAYTYDSMGHVETIETELGSLVTYDYNAAGQITSLAKKLTASANAVTQYDYDDAGNLVLVIDAEQRPVEFDYDLLNRLAATADADQKVWTTVYDALGRPIVATDPTGVTTTTRYDAVGRVARTIGADGLATVYGYNDLDQLILVTDPTGQEAEYTYDWRGNLATVTNDLDVAASATYDHMGRVLSVTNGRNKTTAFEYNDAGQLTLVIEPGTIETQYVYDAAGRLHQRINDRGAVDEYHYDVLDRPAVHIDTAGNDWQTVYDTDGRIDYTIDGKGATTDFAHDLAGRLLTITPAAGAQVSNVYDDTGRLESTTDGNGSTAYGYDPVGRLTQISRGGRVTGYAYDDAGRRTSVTYPGTIGDVEYGYDPYGRIETITDWAERVTTYHYDSYGRLETIDRPGDLVSDITYDALDRPSAIEHAVNGSPVVTLGYTFDANGNIATLADDTGTASMGYDDLDRLTSAAYAGGQNYAYTYDTVGNLTSATTPVGTTTYTYDLADRITSGATPPSYDDNGNLLTDGSYGNRTFSYDPLGRLTGVSGNGVTATYELDGAGNRWAETINGATTEFDLDLSAANPTVLTDGSRTYLPGNPNAGYEQAGVWYSGLTDQTGSPISYVSQTGATTTPVHYDPYGAPRPGSASPTGIGYGGEWTNETGLVNLRARQYDPRMGRFIGRDTFGGIAAAPQSANRYAYALNNPFRYTDPSGHFVHTVIEYSKTPAGRSMLLQSVPGIGDGYSFLIGATGYDPVAGITLSGFERGLSIAAALPFVPGMAGLVGRSGDDLARAGLRYGDELSGSAGLARAGEHYGMGPTRFAGDLGGGGRLADDAVDVGGDAGRNSKAAGATSIPEGSRFGQIVYRGGAWRTPNGRFARAPVVIGEGMDRVTNAASYVRGSEYLGYRNVDGLAQPELGEARIGHNVAWLEEQIASGRPILDIGPASRNVNFPGVTSDSYSIELHIIESSGYDNVFKLTWPP